VQHGVRRRQSTIGFLNQEWPHPAKEVQQESVVCLDEKRLDGLPNSLRHEALGETEK
jgi:hypothetical protein